MPVAVVLAPVLGSVVVPLFIGLAARQLAPDFAGRASRYVAMAGTILLYAWQRGSI